MPSNNFGGINSISFFGVTPFRFTYGTAKIALAQENGQHGIVHTVEITADCPEEALPNMPRKIYVQCVGNDGAAYQVGSSEYFLFWTAELTGGPTPESAKIWRVRIFGSFRSSPIIPL